MTGNYGGDTVGHDPSPALNDDTIDASFNFKEPRGFRIVRITSDAQFETILNAGHGFPEKLEAVIVKIKAANGISVTFL